MEKLKIKKFYLVSIIVGAIICIFSFFWFITLPSPESDLVYSPFQTVGVWTCNEIDLNIISTKNGENEFFVKGLLIQKEKTEQLEFTYKETSVFNHKHAVKIEAYNMLTYQKVFDCFYEFNEGSFVLTDITYYELNLSYKELNFALKA